MGSVQTFSEQTARDIDAEVHRIVMEQYERAKKVLQDNRETLNRITDALIEYETLDAADVDTLMAGGTISRPPPAKPLPTQQAGDKGGKRAGLLDAVGGVPAAGKA
jgi:cell division protease FtsH